MAISTSLETLGSFSLYFGAALIALAIFLSLYMAVTPHNEAALIRKGNTAGAISLMGALIGFTLPLAAVIEYSVSLADMAVWSAIAIAVQLAVYLVVNFLLRAISRQIEDGNLAAGITLAGASVAIGVLNAACMSY
jgi:putative membrane protein